ncbi:MAG TPA: DUF222 domain-containing protein [Aquihabitans sp.]|jgi:hypothetical protein|nr:DUF222 domain-containing protein [Aquihabitans sp.]
MDDGELCEAIERVLEEDADGLDDASLHDLVVAEAQVLSLLAARHARSLSTWDARCVWANDRSRSPGARLARDAACSPATARRDVRRARRLRTMPLTRAAFEAGELSADHVDLLCGANRPPLEALFTRDEALLVAYAKELGYDDLQRVVAHWANCGDDATADERAERGHAERYLRNAKTLDGAVDVQARMEPIGGGIVTTELERLERELFEADWADARAVVGDAVQLHHLARTPAQRRADALVEMAMRSAAMPADAKQGRVLLTVLVDHRTFLDHVCGLGPATDQRLARTATAPPWAPASPGNAERDRQPFEDRVCELSDGTVLTPSQVASILALADVERIVFGPGSRVIDVGVRTRCFTGATRRAIEVRDRHCTFPGCREPAERCHVDHIVEFTDGGLTVQDNGRLLCPVHNRQRPGRSAPPAEGP